MNFTKKTQHQFLCKIKGFAMLEAFIALLVVTVIVSTATLSGITVNNYDKRKTTRNRIQYIQKVLNQYLATYGRLPCPADPTSPISASENRTSGNTTCSSLQFSGTTYYGAVPTDSLNISREYLQDGWSNKIMYIVPKDLTYFNTKNRTVMYYNSTTTREYELTVTTGATVNTSTNFANYIKMYYNDGTNDVTISERNIYALLSYGNNGLGAYTISGTRNSLSGASNKTGELANIIVSSKANNNIYTNQSANGVGFLDDIVYSTSASDIISNNESLVMCDSNIMPDPSSSYSPGSLVQLSQNCGACPPTSGKRNYVECLSGGSWSSVFSRDCTC